MSPRLKTNRRGKVRPARYRSLQLPMLVVLTLVWAALWRDFSAMTLVGGFLVAFISSLVFPLPPLRLEIRVRPVHLVWLIVRFAIDVVISSAQVAWVVLRLNRRPLRNAVVEVNLRTPSDIVMTVVAEMTCLIPGSLVVEARRSTHTLFLHVFDVKDEAGADKFRRGVLAQEARLVRALGRHVDHLDQPEPASPTTGGAT